jgi:hypothetical protein
LHAASPHALIRLLAAELRRSAKKNRFTMKTEISVAATFKRPSAFLPIAMSVIAVAVIIVHIAGSGTAPEKDEGTAAHLWQLLMAAQVPIVAFFIFKRIPQAPRYPFSPHK